MVASANRFDHCQRFESKVMRRLISCVQIVPDHVYGAPERSCFAPSLALHPFGALPGQRPKRLSCRFVEPGLITVRGSNRR